jgi:hypothetical protein
MMRTNVISRFGKLGLVLACCHLAQSMATTFTAFLGAATKAFLICEPDGLIFEVNP